MSDHHDRKDCQMVSRTDWSVTARVLAPLDYMYSVQCKIIALPAFYDVITGPIDFISIVNSGGSTMMLRHQGPHPRGAPSEGPMTFLKNLKKKSNITNEKYRIFTRLTRVNIIKHANFC